MKGITSSQLIVILALIVLGMMALVTVGATEDSLDFVSAQTVEQNTQRVANAIQVMETVPEGYMEIEMADYSIRYRSSGNNLSLNYSNNIGWYEIDDDLISSDIQAPYNYKEIDDNLCLNKTQENSGPVIEINTSGC